MKVKMMLAVGAMALMSCAVGCVGDDIWRDGAVVLVGEEAVEEVEAQATFAAVAYEDAEAQAQAYMTAVSSTPMPSAIERTAQDAPMSDARQQGELDALRAQVKSLAAERDEARAAFSQSERGLGEANVVIKRLESELNSVRPELAAARSDLTALRQRSADDAAGLAALTASEERLAADNEMLKSVNGGLAAERNAAQKALDEARVNHQDAIEDLTRQARDAKSDAERARNDLMETQARVKHYHDGMIDTQRRLDEAQDDLRESVKAQRLLETKLFRCEERLSADGGE